MQKPFKLSFPSLLTFKFWGFLAKKTPLQKQIKERKYVLSKCSTQNILPRLQGQQPASLLALSQPAVLVLISSEIQHSTFPPQK